VINNGWRTGLAGDGLGACRPLGCVGSSAARTARIPCGRAAIDEPFPGQTARIVASKLWELPPAKHLRCWHRRVFSCRSEFIGQWRGPMGDTDCVKEV
jgi:hypothetical protein